MSQALKAQLCIGCLAALFAHDALAAPKKAKKGACDGVTSTTTPKWCVKPPAGYELQPPGTPPETQVFRDKASNQAFDVSWYPKAGGVEGVLKQMRDDVPVEGGKDLKEEKVPGGKLFRYLATNGNTIVMVLAAAGPGATPGSENVVTCRVNLAESHAEFKKQMAACKSLKVLP